MLANVLVVSSKFPPEYSGSGHRILNTYLRLQKKYDINFKVLTSSVTENRNSVYKIQGLTINRISFKPFRSNYFLNSNSSVILINFLSKLIGKVFYRFDFFVEAVLTFFFYFQNRKWIDIVHVIGNVNVTSAAMIFSKIFNKKVIYEVVNFKNNKDYDPLEYYEPFFIKLFYGRGIKVDWQVIVISKALEKLCEKHNPSIDVFHRPNPIDEARFLPVSENKKNLLRKNLTTFSSKDYVICNISKFMPLKNQILLVNVLKTLPEKYKLLLIGPLVKNGPLAKRDNEYLSSIIKLISSLKLQNRVIIQTEFHKNVQEYYQLSDVFAFPTTDEALGTPMLESLACAVPVVMTNIKGVSDTWIKDGINGYLSKLSVNEFAEKIILSSYLDKKILAENSEQLSKIASTMVIDHQYKNFFSL